MIRQSNPSILAIRVEPEYRFVARSLSGWGPKGEHNAAFIIASEVTNFLRWRCSYRCSFGML
jgi:hypothetical protein